MGNKRKRNVSKRITHALDTDSYCRGFANTLVIVLTKLSAYCMPFSGGNCNMKCSAPTKCEFSCTTGNCKTVICEADTCEESCTGGGCGLECHGKSCEQSCTKGNCHLQCPYNAEKCEQRCTINKDKCTIEDYVPDECDSLDGGVCIQSCTGGGCSNMECFNSSLYYHSCEQSCTGKFSQIFPHC